MRHHFTIAARDYCGVGEVIYNWSAQGSLLACSGTERKVFIFSRDGQLFNQDRPVSLPPAAPDEKAEIGCVALEWDSTEERLAIVTAGSSVVLVWNAATRDTQKIDTQLKDLCFAKWAKGAKTLCVGNCRGDVFIYDAQGGRKETVPGKHSKRIRAGAWSRGGRLALAGEDNKITISDGQGKLIVQRGGLRGVPDDMAFSDCELGDGFDNAVSVVLGQKSLFVMKTSETRADVGEPPLDLNFEESYGRLLVHRWCGGPNVMLGFSNGFVLVISVHDKSIPASGQGLRELFRAQLFKPGRDFNPADPDSGSALTDLAYCSRTNKAVACGETIKVIQKVVDKNTYTFVDVQEDTVVLDRHQISKVSWTDDGQILTAATANGDIICHITALATLSAASDSRVCYVTGKEMKVYDTQTGEWTHITLEVEPFKLAMGPFHVAAALNDQAWFYSLDGSPAPVNVMTYVATVDDLVLNDRVAAVLIANRVRLHFIDRSMDPNQEHERTLPQGPNRPDLQHDVTCIATSPHFLIYGTAHGTLCYYNLEHNHTREYRYGDRPILHLWPSASGLRVLFFQPGPTSNQDGDFVLYNPVSDEVLLVPDFSAADLDLEPEAVLWDTADPTCFVAADARDFHSYCYRNSMIGGAEIVKLEPTSRPPYPHEPVLFRAGILTCQLPGGKLTSAALRSHTELADTALDITTRGPDALQRRFDQALQLGRLPDAWDCALQISTPETLQALAQEALLQMELELAIRVFRSLGDACMVLSLETISRVEDKKLLAGHLLVLLGGEAERYDEAQALFLASTRPLAALEMRKDLKHWDEAMVLARRLAPEQLPALSAEYAQLLEHRGEYDAALKYFQQAQQAAADDKTRFSCLAGTARTLLHTAGTGDHTRRGKQLALDSGSAQLCRECAAILEAGSLFLPAAELYQRAGMLEKAAALYINNKAFTLAAPLMDKVATPKLHVLYARAKEAEGQFKEACASYEAAKDFDNVARLCLDQLGDPQRAFAVVRRSRSQDGALAVAKFCQKSGDNRTAIEFLVLARKSEEAFSIAVTYGLVDTYLEALSQSGGTPEEFVSLSAHYEAKRELGSAGDCLAKAGRPDKALELYLAAGEPCVPRAIALVGETKDAKLAERLVQHLMSSGRTVPDENAMFEIYVALKDYDKAAHTMVLIARQEQELGNYKLAHSKLFDTHKELVAKGRRPPQELVRALGLLHSYVLVKAHVRMGDHANAARLLARVAKNISRFPSHVVPILTSTVIECQRAGMKRVAFEHASTLMRPENRPQIAEAYKRKIETIVRKRDMADDVEEPHSECPFCSTLGPASELQCVTCQSLVPYCLASGDRMTLAGCAQCPSCRFPCKLEAFKRVVGDDKVCPMCNQQVVLAAIQPVEDAHGFLKGLLPPG